MQDDNGDLVSFLPAIGPGSVTGLPFSGEQLVNVLTRGRTVEP
jgi:phospholipid/cholesterol/gamma-HCH transport system substrate-binding protein